MTEDLRHLVRGIFRLLSASGGVSGLETCATDAFRRNLGNMVVLIRLVRVLLIMVLAVFAVSSIVGIAASETGVVEKAVLVALFAGCVLAAAQVTKLASKLQARVPRY